MDFKGSAVLFKGLCDENRLQILSLLSEGERCACHLQEVLPIGQSTLSHHMKILVESGIVRARRSGKWIYYAIDPKGIERARDLLDLMVAIRPNAQTQNQMMCAERA